MKKQGLDMESSQLERSRGLNEIIGNITSSSVKGISISRSPMRKNKRAYFVIIYFGRAIVFKEIIKEFRRENSKKKELSYSK